MEKVPQMFQFQATAYSRRYLFAIIICLFVRLLYPYLFAIIVSKKVPGSKNITNFDTFCYFVTIFAIFYISFCPFLYCCPFL